MRSWACRCSGVRSASLRLVNMVRSRQYMVWRLRFPLVFGGFFLGLEPNWAYSPSVGARLWTWKKCTLSSVCKRRSWVLHCGHMACLGFLGRLSRSRSLRVLFTVGFLAVAVLNLPSIVLG